MRVTNETLAAALIAITLFGGSGPVGRPDRAESGDALEKRAAETPGRERRQAAPERRDPLREKFEQAQSLRFMA